MTNIKWDMREMNNHKYSYSVFNPDNGETIALTFPNINEKANARLIAAAPELVNVLKRVMVIWDREGFGSNGNESEPLYYDIKTLIAKIEGGRE